MNTLQTETEFFIGSETEFIRCFRERDQAKLILPAGLPFPIRIRSYFTWQEPSGIYTYLIYKKPGWDLPRGMAFKRITGLGEPTGGLCSWCHNYGSSEEIGTLSVAVNSKTTFAYILCQDLRCIEKIEEAAARAGKSPEGAIHQLYHRLDAMFENVAHYKQE